MLYAWLTWLTWLHMLFSRAGKKEKIRPCFVDDNLFHRETLINADFWFLPRKTKSFRGEYIQHI
jgi:hypothetical protein